MHTKYKEFVSVFAFLRIRLKKLKSTYLEKSSFMIFMVQHLAPPIFQKYLLFVFKNMFASSIVIITPMEMQLFK